MMIRILPALLLLLSFDAKAQMSEIDFRYSPEYWYSAIGFPLDHHKTLVDDHGALLYDFGPGPYVTPKTRAFFLPPAGATRAQGYDDPRVPIVQTRYSRDGVLLHTVSSYAVPPDDQSFGKTNSQSVLPSLKRIGGLTGTLSWAQPPAGYDPAFRNVAWGTNRPIEYELHVPPGSTKQIALGFCESYRDKPGMRKLAVQVEGASAVPVEPVPNEGSRNIPMAVVIEGTDTDGDGVISIEVLSTEGDPNTILNALWVFEEAFSIDMADLLAGRLSRQAEVYVDAGRDEQVTTRLPRFDVLRLAAQHPGEQILRIETKRQISVEDGIVFTDGFAFALSRPQPSRWTETPEGIDLYYNAPARDIEVVFQDGFEASTQAFPVSAVTRNFDGVSNYWLAQTRIPYPAISVPDQAMQHVLDASLRTVYQFTEIVDGQFQAQPGAALYRGQWMHDGVYFVDLFAQMGDLSSARQLINRLLSFQHDSGQAEIMRPSNIHRETPLLIWLLCRYAELTNDEAWLVEHWQHVETGINWIEHLRSQTLVEGAPNYGLTPSGFADGGIHGVQPEYATVNWVLIALPAAIEAATRIGRTKDAENWTALYAAFLNSFEDAAERDVQHDQFGNPYLPIRVGVIGSPELPQQAQWLVPEALIYGDYIQPSDSLAVGTMRMLESHQSQGLIASTGWLKDGIWGYFGGFLAEAYLRTGDGARAAALLYAMANHASPVYTWPEEQMPVGKGRRTAGDFPHGWASSTMPRLAIRLLAFENGDDLTLLRGIPTEWLKAGSQTTLHHIATRFGKIDLDVVVSDSGDQVQVRVSPLNSRGDSKLEIDWRQFDRAGFSVPSTTPNPNWQEAYTVTLFRN